ncbi:MAG: TonB-dependent receptor [Bacteroidetes bacterium 4572_77]|nr:MAG: TonB-dependent receptor [Bacteroidetes bacterium 4572_77]
MIYKHTNLSLLFLIIMFLGMKGFSQSISEKKMKEHYWGTPLPKVLNDLKEKYGVNITYDSVVVAQYRFDDRGRTSYGSTVGRALKAICSDIEELNYYIDEEDVVHLGASSHPQNKSELLVTKYKGSAQKTNFTISGIVKDKDSGETLPYASILLKNTSNGVITNIDGYFTLFNVPTDTSALKVSYMGYQTETFYLNPEAELSDLIIILKADAKVLAEVEITADVEELMEASDRISVVKMSPKKMAELPNIGEKDIFRSFQLLPGVSGSNESSSGLYVRGGTPDQNLILYDGFTVYHVDHLFGMFSAFNSNAVKDVQLHKGGFAPQFGGRISSVMEIVGKDGNENNFNIGGDIGLLSANLYTEIPLAKNLTLLMAGRRSWKSFIYEDIFNSFNDVNTTETTPTPSPPSGGGGFGGGGGGGRTMETTTPTSYFYDLNAKLTFKPTKKDIISYSFFNGQDNLDNSRDINRERGGMIVSGGTTDLTKWGSWGMSNTWSRKWNKNYYSNVLVSMSNYFSTRDMSSSRMITKSDGSISEINRGSLEDNNLRDYSFKFDNELKFGEYNLFEFGVQSTYFDIKYDYTKNDTINLQQKHDLGSVTSVYLQDKVNLGKKLTFTPGVRVSYYDVTDKVYYEPRLSLNYQLSEKFRLKGAWGHYYQFANRIIRNDISSGSKDFWVLADGESIPISFAEHFIAGFSYETNGYLFDVEAYYKKLDGLSEYSLQFAPSVGSQNYDDFYYKGTGTAKGLEFLLQKKYGKYNGWVSYEDFLDIGQKNGSRYPDYHRLDLSATYNFKIGKHSSGSIGGSVFNAYNRQNIWYKEFEIEEGELIETDVTLLGITPSITLSFKLR